MAKSKPLVPKTNGNYHDGRGRKLHVTEVNLKSSLGRDVVGQVTYPDGNRAGYSTNLLTFVEIWKEDR